MDDTIETVGTLVAGGIAAREAERLHAPDASGHDVSGACANCGAVLTDTYCSRCGQHGHVHRTAGALVHDLLHGVFHFEGKLWATLPMLAFKPGELTRRYVHGERAKFVSPIALFLFSVFLMFTLVANLPGWDFGGANLIKPRLATQLAQTRERLSEERAAAQGRVAKAVQRVAEARSETTPSADDVAAAERRLARERKALNEIVTTEKALAAADLPTIKASPGSAGGKWLEEKVRHVKENPQLMIYKIKTSAYKFSWALIPISLPFLWLLFPLRRDVGMYDHAIFATYSLTFMSLLVVVLAVLGAIGIPGAALVLCGLAIVPLHMYRQLKGAYRLGRLGTLWRLFWLLNFTVFTTTLFSFLLLYLGVAD